MENCVTQSKLMCHNCRSICTIYLVISKKKEMSGFLSDCVASTCTDNSHLIVANEEEMQKKAVDYLLESLKGRRGRPKYSKQAEVRQMIFLLDLDIEKITHWVARVELPKEYKLQLRTKVLQKRALEKVLNRLVLNQKRQKRHRQRKKNKSFPLMRSCPMEDITDSEVQSNELFNSSLSNVSNPTYLAQAAMEFDENYLNPLFPLHAEFDDDPHHEMQYSDSLLSIPENYSHDGCLSLTTLNSSDNESSTKYATASPIFTQQQWNMLEELYSLLRSCPFLGDGLSIASLHACDQLFLNRISELLATATTNETVREATLLVYIRSIFLKDCGRYGEIPARFFLYLMVVERKQVTLDEKSRICQNYHFA